MRFLRLWGLKHSLDEKPRRPKLFYAVIAVSTLVGILINFIGVNPIKHLSCGSHQRFSRAADLGVIMLVANNQAVLGRDVNGPLRCHGLDNYDSDVCSCWRSGLDLGQVQPADLRSVLAGHRKRYFSVRYHGVLITMMPVAPFKIQQGLQPGAALNVEQVLIP